MYFLITALVALCAVVDVQSNTFRMGACPRVVVMKNMDFDKFLGDWYVVQRFNPMATCTKIHIEKSPEGIYSINETSRPLGINFNLHNQFIKARQLEFLRNDTKSIYRAQRDFTHFTLSTYGVMDTDYESYALVWGCDPVLFGSVQNVDILSRKPNPNPEIIKAARDVLKEKSIDYQPLDNVDQTRCSDSSSSTEGSSNNDDKNTNNIIVR